MSIQTDDGETLQFDLYLWTQVSEGDVFKWTKDGYTITANYNSLAAELEMTLQTPDGSVEQLPRLTDFHPDNVEEIRRGVEDVLSQQTGQW